MAGTSTPAKRLRPAHSSLQQHAAFVSLIVDGRSGSILQVGPLSPETFVSAGHAAKFDAVEGRAHALLFELTAIDATPAQYFLVRHERGQGVPDATHALAGADLAIDVDVVPHPDGAKESLVRTLIKKTLASLQEIQGRHAGVLTEDEVIREVGQTLAERPSANPVSVEEGWQELLDRGIKSKMALLKSGTFKSTAQVSELLGIGEPAVRKRIREQKLVALKVPGSGEHRIPMWALDPGVAGAATSSLYTSVSGWDEWQLYHFLSTPNGNLNGLRPFECLLSGSNLTPTLRAARDELMSELKLTTAVSLRETVERELKAQAQEGRYE